MSYLKLVLMKRDEITSDEADDLIKAAMRNRIFRVPLVQKRQHAHSLLTPGAGPAFEQAGRRKSAQKRLTTDATDQHRNHMAQCRCVSSKLTGRRDRLFFKACRKKNRRSPLDHYRHIGQIL